MVDIVWLCDHEKQMQFGKLRIQVIICLTQTLITVAKKLLAPIILYVYASTDVQPQ